MDVNDDIETCTQSRKTVLMSVIDAMQALDFAEAHSSYHRGESPELDAAFDVARHAVETVGDMLRGEL